MGEVPPRVLAAAVPVPRVVPGDVQLEVLDQAVGAAVDILDGII